MAKNQQPKAKIPKSLLFIPAAAVLCCLGLPLLAALGTATVFSFLSANAFGIVIFGILAFTLSVFLIRRNYRNKNDCC